MCFFAVCYSHDEKSKVDWVLIMYYYFSLSPINESMYPIRWSLLPQSRRLSPGICFVAGSARPQSRNYTHGTFTSQYVRWVGWWYLFLPSCFRLFDTVEVQHSACLWVRYFILYNVKYVETGCLFQSWIYPHASLVRFRTELWLGVVSCSQHPRSCKIRTPKNYRMRKVGGQDRQYVSHNTCFMVWVSEKMAKSFMGLSNVKIIMVSTHEATCSVHSGRSRFYWLYCIIIPRLLFGNLEPACTWWGFLPRPVVLRILRCYQDRYCLVAGVFLWQIAIFAWLVSSSF